MSDDRGLDHIPDPGLVSHIRVWLGADGSAQCGCGETFRPGLSQLAAWEKWCDHALDEHAESVA